MMEQADMRHNHGHVVFVTGGNDVVIANGATGLGNVGNAALMGALDVVAEREKRVRA